MKSPCHECDHHLSGGDKNHDRCRECVPRVVYVESLGSLASNVPDHMTDYVEISAKPVDDIQKEETVMETKSDRVVKTKICSHTECPFNGIPQPLDDFDNNASSRGGKASNCKACRRRLQALYQKRKKAKAVKTVSVKEQAKSPEKPDDKIIRIDFSNHNDIYDDLLKMADEQLRTPENQALFIFKSIYEMGLGKSQVSEQKHFFHLFKLP